MEYCKRIYCKYCILQIYNYICINCYENIGNWNKTFILKINILNYNFNDENVQLISHISSIIIHINTIDKKENNGKKDRDRTKIQKPAPSLECRKWNSIYKVK